MAFFFYLKLTNFNVWDMLIVFFANWVLLDHFDPQKTEVLKVREDTMDFFYITSKYSKYATLSFFLKCYTASAPISCKVIINNCSVILSPQVKA